MAIPDDNCEDSGLLPEADKCQSPDEKMPTMSVLRALTTPSKFKRIAIINGPVTALIL